MRKEWTIKSLLEWTAEYFKKKGFSASRLEAELLLATILGHDRVYLYVNYDKPLNDDECKLYREVILRRVHHEPYAYITGQKEFMSLKLNVNNQVLIPRPETEMLVEEALKAASALKSARICDVGTGSGAIAVSLAYYCPSAQVYASDISEAALAVAIENAKINNVKVDFRSGDLLEPFMSEEPFDIIVANLPYISEDEYKKLMPEVRKYEPLQALLAPGDGLDLYRRFLPQARELLYSKGYLLIEIGYTQGSRAAEMMQGFTEVQIKRDYSGKNRMLQARKM
ncbi:MAG: peptide chain release factor N(5)-glutamine methyltransferase [Syntrophomonadaceae bacterium]|nr:peptide chain release factor N(5)-glutamine methyltransferase [Syntrophomonadaceae bacterium]